MQDIRASFLDEAEKMREANCGIKVYQLGELRDGRPYFSMEFCDQSLVQWLDEGRALPELERWRRVVGMGIEILKLLAHMHEKWIVHQDLKPANIMLKDGAPRILDYGLARTRDQVQALGVCRMGTRAYMSPEALTGAPDAKHPHTDLYSFSIILYEVLTGVFPFDDVSGVDVRNRVPKDAPVDPKLKQILWANLTADPKERKCQSASDMRRALEGYLPAKRHQTG
jgi:serine/threonine protein kinase